MSLDQILGLLLEKIVTWGKAIITNLPNLVVAVLIIFVFTFLARLANRIVKNSLPKATINPTVTNLAASLVYLVVVLIGAFIALETLHLDKAVTSILAGVGVIGLALGFAFQEIAANFVAGVFIAFNQPYRLGDIVTIQGFLGTVTSVDLRTTSITSFDGLEVLVPNKVMFTEPLTNFTTTPKRRVDLKVGISYGDDLDLVEKLATQAVMSIEGRIESEEVQFYYTEFGDSSINFELRFWVEYPGDNTFLKAQHQAIKKLKVAFDKGGVTIPFPIRTLDFGIKGGEGLKTVLGKSQ